MQLSGRHSCDLADRLIQIDEVEIEARKCQFQSQAHVRYAAQDSQCFPLGLWQHHVVEFCSVTCDSSPATTLGCTMLLAMCGQDGISAVEIWYQPGITLHMVPCQ